MDVMEQADWLYDRAEGRKKHRWKYDEAGFHPSPKGPVGKCHASITDELAQSLLRKGVPYFLPGSTTAEHVYAVYRGVIYEAAPTQPGLSWHGYPWRGDLGAGPLPPRIVRQLREMAEHDGYHKEFEAWLKQYGR